MLRIDGFFFQFSLLHILTMDMCKLTLLHLLLTTKVMMEVSAPDSGHIKSVHVEGDDTVTVGQLLMILTPGEVDAALEKAAETTNDDPPAEKAPSSSSSSSSSAPAASSSPASSSASSSSTPSSSSSHRVPMIQFRHGVREEGMCLSFSSIPSIIFILPCIYTFSYADRLFAVAEAEAEAPRIESPLDMNWSAFEGLPPAAIPFTGKAGLPPKFVQPSLTDEEMERINVSSVSLLILLLLCMLTFPFTFCFLSISFFTSNSFSLFCYLLFSPLFSLEERILTNFRNDLYLFVDFG